MNSSESSAPIPSSAGLSAGQTVGAGRFLLKKQLGHGGMGVVWLAHDLRLGEPVALKFLPPQIAHDPAALEDMRRETLRSRKLSHPNIVRIHDFIQPENEPPFISMEYVDGPDLHYLRESRPLKVMTWKILAPLVRQLLAVLDYAHAEKVVHRDLKPANLMLDSSGRLRLADFGLARVAHDSVTRLSGMTMPGGTINFMSPQQADGKAAQPSDDIYALGSTLYDLLTSRPPFYQGDVSYQVRHTRPDPMPQRLLELGLINEIPSEVSALVMACLAKEPEQRPPDARAILQFLDAAEKNESTVLVPGAAAPVETAPLPAIPPLPPAPPPKTPAPAAAPQWKAQSSLAHSVGIAFVIVFLLALLGLVTVGGWWWYQRMARRDATWSSSQPGTTPPVAPPVAVPPVVTPPVPRPVEVAVAPSPDRWETCGGSMLGGRIYHSVVWTGTEVIIWGGGGAGKFYNDGAAYNPVTQQWRKLSTANAPSPRWGHAAVWTGREMIVWGGRSVFQLTQSRSDGGRYDPATDAWRPLSREDAPTARSQCVAAWTGEEMIIWSGVGDGDQVPSDGARYQPATDRWTPMSAVAGPEGRLNAGSVWTGKELIVWGGIRRANKQDMMADGGRYDPKQNRWRPISREAAPGARHDFSLVWTGQEMILCGGSSNADGRFSEPCPDSFRYQPNTDKWTPLPNVPPLARRHSHTAIWTGREVILWGGGSTGHRNYLNSGVRFNPSSGVWTPMTTTGSPAARVLHNAIWAGPWMFIFGGSTGGFEAFNDLSCYTP